MLGTRFVENILDTEAGNQLIYSQAPAVMDLQEKKDFPARVAWGRTLCWGHILDEKFRRVMSNFQENSGVGYESLKKFHIGSVVLQKK